MTIDEFVKGFSRLRLQQPGVHSAKPALKEKEVVQWINDHPNVRMPLDYVNLLRKHNGFAFFAQEETDGMFHFLPFREVEPMLHDKFNGGLPWQLEPDERKTMAPWFGIALDGNGEHTLAIDTSTGEFLILPHTDPWHPFMVLPNLEAALDWALNEYDIIFAAPQALAGTGSKTKKKAKATLTEAFPLPGHETPVQFLLPLPNTDHFISGASGLWAVNNAPEQLVRVWSISERRQIDSLLTEQFPCYFLSVDRSGRCLCYHRHATGRVEDEYIFVDLQTRTEVFRHGADWNPRGCSPVGAFMADGERFLAAQPNGSILVLNFRSAKQDHVLSGHSPAVWAVQMSHDGSFAVSGAKDGRILVWDLTTFTLCRELERQTSAVSSFAFTPDDRKLVVGTRSAKFARVFDFPSGKALCDLAPHRKGGIRGIAIAPDGKRAVTAGQDGEIRYSDIESGELIGSAVVGGPFEPICGAANFHCGVSGVLITSDGKRCITGCEDRLIRVWELPA